MTVYGHQFCPKDPRGLDVPGSRSCLKTGEEGFLESVEYMTVWMTSRFNHTIMHGVFTHMFLVGDISHDTIFCDNMISKQNVSPNCYA